MFARAHFSWHQSASSKSQSRQLAECRRPSKVKKHANVTLKQSQLPELRLCVDSGLCQKVNSDKYNQLRLHLNVFSFLLLLLDSNSFSWLLPQQLPFSNSVVLLDGSFPFHFF